MKKKLFLLTLLFFYFSNSLYSQINEISTPCDCIDIAIKNHQLIEDGHSEYNASKILENQNKQCVELKNILGRNFEKQILLCDNFSNFSKIFSSKKSDFEEKSEICDCVNSSISILEEIKKTGNEISTIKKFKDDIEFCEKIKDKYSDQEYGMLMINCPKYNELMELILSLKK